MCIIVSCNVSCYKHGKLQYVLNEGDVIGKICLFTHYESNYDYYTEENCVVIQIIYSVLNEVFEGGENLIQMIIIKNIFKMQLNHRVYFRNTLVKIIIQIYLICFN